MGLEHFGNSKLSQLTERVEPNIVDMKSKRTLSGEVPQIDYFENKVGEAYEWKIEDSERESIEPPQLEGLGIKQDVEECYYSTDGERLEKIPSEDSEHREMDFIQNDKKVQEVPLETNHNIYNDLDAMKQVLDKTYKEIKADKPPNSPKIPNWFENGGSIRIEKTDEKTVWTYIDKEGKEVSYVDGYPVFPPEAKHPVIDDINIGKFTGDRNEDKRLYLKNLEEQYGLTEIPDGYALHHDSKNGNMQLIKTDWHKEFTHAGGHSLFKEGV